MSEALPELDRPPLNEVVYGLRFPQPALLKTAHYGLFWSRVRDRYPRAEDADPIIDVPADGKVEIDPHRVWLLNDSGTRLLQFQRGRFYMNWRQIQPTDEYPRFSRLFPDFQDTAAAFADFVKELGLGELTPTQLELTYINHIYEGAGWRFPADAGLVLAPLTGWKRDRDQRFGAPTDLVWRMNTKGPGDMQVIAAARGAHRKTDSASLLTLELRAISPFSGGGTLAEAFDWYPRAREEIVRSFFDLTTQGARDKLWT